MSGRLIPLDKQLGLRLVGVRETWRQLFAKCVLNVMLPADIHACKDEQICMVLNTVIDWAVNGV